MIKQLRLKNFRKHTDSTVSFSEGLNALKGANEQGKSTLTEALLYLWFGSRALKEGLKDVVTYGESEKTLRVEGDFSFDGVEYTMYRCTAGSEIVYGSHRVTGQTETASFMERLLGAKSDIVRKLMIAEQNSVRGILESEAEAGNLIESLAELSQIDALIEKIQVQWPTGPTKGAEATLRTLQEAVGAVPEEPSQEAVEAAKAPVDALAARLTKLEAQVAELTPQVEEAKATLEKDRQNKLRESDIERQRTTLLAVQLPEPCTWTYADYEAAKESEKNLAYRDKVLKAKAFVAETTYQGSNWTGTVESLNAEIAATNAKLGQLSEEATNLKVSIASKKAMEINSGVCSFCKMDLTQQPEVKITNEKVRKAVAELEDRYRCVAEDVKNLKSTLAILNGIVATHNQNLQAVNKEFWEPLAGAVPMQFRWIGPELVENEGEFTPSSTILSELRSYEQSLARYESAKQQLESLEVVQHIPQEQLDKARQVIGTAEVLDSTVRLLTSEFAEAKSVLWKAEAEYAGNLKVYEAAVASRNSALENMKRAEETLAELEYNNQLIKDIREARSEIRRKLWEATNAAISVYFSRVRKVDTRITYGDKGFLQNSRSVKGLSGSAKDMLGLSIRAALIKTFAPQASLLVLDEPFAGCDADREAAGLAVLCQLGFPQTLLVTHSDLADTVASNLIQL